jgi:hypothetical protein
VEATKREKIQIHVYLVLIIFFFSISSSVISFHPPVRIIHAGDISTWSDTNTTLSVAVQRIAPRINWYDLRNETGVSKRNQQIDVNQKYTFCINISSDQGWDDIDYINITAWYDHGNESTIYNQTQGGNLNMFLQYRNTSGTALYKMRWPDDEASNGNFTEHSVSDPAGTTNTACRNVTFAFTPGYQMRYAPGDGSWDNTRNSTNDNNSWNFNISVVDSGENFTKRKIVWVDDEFGIYSYTEVASGGNPSIQGLPGENATTPISISLTTRSNGNYSLAVDIEDLVHTKSPLFTISNQTLWVRGGDLGSFTNFDGASIIYLYGNSSTYISAEDNNASQVTDNIDYRCEIPMAQLQGNYEGTITYILKTQT